MLKNIPIKEVMSCKLITLHPKDKLKRAKDIFKEYDIHHIPIVVMKRLVGILSQGDILYLESVITTSFDRFVLNKKFELDTVEEVMTPNPICIDIENNLSDVLEKMLKYKVNAIPVEKNNELVGLVTTRDLLKIMAQSFDE
jgi:CBS domain-containing protein